MRVFPKKHATEYIKRVKIKRIMKKSVSKEKVKNGNYLLRREADLAQKKRITTRSNKTLATKDKKL